MEQERVALECHGKHTPLVSSTSSSKNCSIFGWWQSISQVASSSWSQGTCTSSDCSFILHVSAVHHPTLLNYCSMIVVWVHVPRWHSHLEKHHCTLQYMEQSCLPQNHQPIIKVIKSFSSYCPSRVHPMMIGVVFHHCILLVRITLPVK